MYACNSNEMKLSANKDGNIRADYAIEHQQLRFLIDPFIQFVIFVNKQFSV